MQTSFHSAIIISKFIAIAYMEEEEAMSTVKYYFAIFTCIYILYLLQVQSKFVILIFLVSFFCDDEGIGGIYSLLSYGHVL